MKKGSTPPSADATDPFETSTLDSAIDEAPETAENPEPDAAGESPPAALPPESQASRFWQLFARGAVVAGRAAASASVTAAGLAADAYRSVDPDLRRHVAHTPIVGLTHLLPTAPIAALPDDGHNPVIFVHGLAGHPGNFFALRQFMAFHGRTRGYAVPLPGRARFPVQADALSHAIREVCAVNGLPDTARVDIVAHSMGGLVTRYALEDAAVRERIGRIVTLGTPHTGTWAARYAATHQTLDLRPTADVMTVLNAQIPWAAAWPRLFTFWSRADMLLLPPESALVDGGVAVDCSDVSHMSYLLNPRVFARVVECLAPVRAGFAL